MRSEFPLARRVKSDTPQDGRGETATRPFKKGADGPTPEASGPRYSRTQAEQKGRGDTEAEHNCILAEWDSPSKKNPHQPHRTQACDNAAVIHNVEGPNKPLPTLDASDPGERADEGERHLSPAEITDLRSPAGSIGAVQPRQRSRSGFHESFR
jgi:hypothetical protein